MELIKEDLHSFDKIIERRNTNSQKWDQAQEDDIIAMWVADMDFQASIAIRNALQKVVQQGVFGYAKVPDEYYLAINDWFNNKYDFTIKKEWILHTTGVIPALSATIKALIQPGDKIVIQTPVYNGFFSAIHNNQCEIVGSDLIYEKDTYHIDFDDLSNKLSDPAVKLFILCNPHNPVGRVWTREELQKIGDLCIENNVFIISDEIHCDLVFPPHRHLPFASINPTFLSHSITCTSPSKSFNLAGLQVANIFVENNLLREKISLALKSNSVNDISPFAIAALIAAYRDSHYWLDLLLSYLNENYHYLKDFIAKELPQLKVIQLEATYLVWIDCLALGIKSSEIKKELYTKGKVWINEGTIYGEAGEHFIRINIACPLSTLKQGLERIKKIIHSY